MTRKAVDNYMPLYEFQYRILSGLSDEARLTMYDAMCAYAFDGVDVGVSCDADDADVLEIIWPIVREMQIEKRCKAVKVGNAKRKPISSHLRFEIFKRDGFRCVYCGATAADTELVVDHVKPVALGGTNEPDNLVTACKECNYGKYDRPLDRGDL